VAPDNIWQVNQHNNVKKNQKIGDFFKGSKILEKYKSHNEFKILITIGNILD
jgi:hypothetical protein